MAFATAKANGQQETYQTPGAPLVQVEQVSRVVESRIQKITILDDISFVVPAQSLFAINGPSGSGKSTLLNMLTGIDRPTSGRIVFGGEQLRAKGENALARWRGRHVGIVFQFFQLLPTLTSEENVLLALELGGLIPRRQWRARTAEVLALVGLSEYARRLPGELSGGQQQRVAIARALANNPPVLVADEPTGNLDSKTAAQVFTLLENLTHQGKTVIYVTHDPRLAARASHRIELLDGRIVGQEDQGRQPLAVGAQTSGATGELEAAR
ncbi:MAG TPA: ABC transporter ATP-binding protein [Ktedonobacterales bacterium]|nr:ABC transporter ATP-binding protein [Ktedonobacterales bacterium]